MLRMISQPAPDKQLALLRPMRRPAICGPSTRTCRSTLALLVSRSATRHTHTHTHTHAPIGGAQQSCCNVLCCVSIKQQRTNQAVMCSRSLCQATLTMQRRLCPPTDRLWCSPVLGPVISSSFWCVSFSPFFVASFAGLGFWFVMFCMSRFCPTCGVFFFFFFFVLNKNVEAG